MVCVPGCIFMVSGCMFMVYVSGCICISVTVRRNLTSLASKDEIMELYDMQLVRPCTEQKSHGANHVKLPRIITTLHDSKLDNKHFNKMFSSYEVR